MKWKGVSEGKWRVTIQYKRCPFHSNLIFQKCEIYCTCVDQHNWDSKSHPRSKCQACIRSKHLNIKDYTCNRSKHMNKTKVKSAKSQNYWLIISTFLTLWLKYDYLFISSSILHYLYVCNLGKIDFGIFPGNLMASVLSRTQSHKNKMYLGNLLQD